MFRPKGLFAFSLLLSLLFRGGSKEVVRGRRRKLKKHNGGSRCRDWAKKLGPKSSFPDPIAVVSQIPIILVFLNRFVATRRDASRRPLFLPHATLFAQTSQHVRYMYTELYSALHVKHTDFEAAIIPGSEIVSEMIRIV